MSTLVFSWLILASLGILKRIICRHMSLQMNAQIARKIWRYSSSPSPGFGLFTMVRNLCKCYRTKKVFYSAICLFTEVVTFRSCLRKHAVVVAFEVEWKRSLAWLYDKFEYLLSDSNKVKILSMKESFACRRPSVVSRFWNDYIPSAMKLLGAVDSVSAFVIRYWHQ